MAPQVPSRTRLEPRERAYPVEEHVDAKVPSRLWPLTAASPTLNPKRTAAPASVQSRPSSSESSRKTTATGNP